MSKLGFFSFLFLELWSRVNSNHTNWDLLCLRTNTQSPYVISGFLLGLLGHCFFVCVFLFFFILLSSLPWPCRFQGLPLIALFPVSFWAHPTPAWPTQLRVSLYTDVITGPCCSFCYIPTLSLLFFLLFLSSCFFEPLFSHCLAWLCFHLALATVWLLLAYKPSMLHLHVVMHIYAVVIK